MLQQRYERRIVVNDRDVDPPSKWTGRLHTGDADRSLRTGFSRSFHRFDRFFAQCGECVAVGLVLRDATAAGDVYAPPIVSEEIELRDLGTDLRQFYRCGVFGAAVHPDHEIRAAPPARHVLGAERLREQRADPTQYTLGEGAPEILGEAAEGIDLKNSNRIRIRFPTSEPEKSIDQLGCLERCREASEGIGLYRGFSRFDAAEATFDAHHQFRGDERFPDVIVRARGEDALHAHLIGVSAEEDYRQLAPPSIIANYSTKFDAADLRHLEIEQDEVRLRLLERGPESERVVYRGNNQTPTTEQRAQTASDERLVVDDENAFAAELRFLDRGGDVGGTRA